MLLGVPNIGVQYTSIHMLIKHFQNKYGQGKLEPTPIITVSQIKFVTRQAQRKDTD